MNRHKIFILLFLFPMTFYAQRKNECVEEMLRIEEKSSFKNSRDDNKVFYLSYAVNTTDWENQTTLSNVKIYKKKNNMHFFSEQGQIFQDEKDSYCVLPVQKVLIISSMKKELNNMTVDNNFYQFRKSFLDSCEIVRCEGSPQDPSVKTLELKVIDNLGGKIHIVKMIYKYNVKTEKIISTTTFYNKNYKINKIETIFNEVSYNYSYKFSKARKYIVDKNGNLLSKYTGYEIVDNRE